MALNYLSDYGNLSAGTGNGSALADNYGLPGFNNRGFNFSQPAPGSADWTGTNAGPSWATRHPFLESMGLGAAGKTTAAMQNLSDASGRSAAAGGGLPGFYAAMNPKAKVTGGGLGGLMQAIRPADASAGTAGAGGLFGGLKF